MSSIKISHSRCMQGPGISKFSSTMVKLSTNWSFYVHLGVWNFKIFLNHGEDEYKISHSRCMQGPGNSKFSSTMVKSSAKLVILSASRDMQFHNFLLFVSKSLSWTVDIRHQRFLQSSFRSLVDWLNFYLRDDWMKFLFCTPSLVLQDEKHSAELN